MGPCREFVRRCCIPVCPCSLLLPRPGACLSALGAAGAGSAMARCHLRRFLCKNGCVGPQLASHIPRGACMPSSGKNWLVSSKWGKLDGGNDGRRLGMD